MTERLFGLKKCAEYYLWGEKQWRILHSWCFCTDIKPTSTVLEVGGAEGLVRDMISWIARRSFRRCNGLLIPISLWISVSDSADIMAPLFTLARHAATYQAGMPTHSWPEGGRGETLPWVKLDKLWQRCNWFKLFLDSLYLQPNHNSRSIPLGEWQALPASLIQQFMPKTQNIYLGQNAASVHTHKKNPQSLSKFQYAIHWIPLSEHTHTNLKSSIDMQTETREQEKKQKLKPKTNRHAHLENTMWLLRIDRTLANKD